MRHCLCGSVLLVIATLAGTTGTADARIRVTGHRPVVAPAGGRLQVTVKLRGPATLTLRLAGATRKRVKLSRHATRVKGHRLGRVRLLGRVPKTIPRDHKATLLVCAAKRCVRVVRLRTSGPDQASRLAAAVKGHRLAPSASVLYGLYALNRDPRLPLELRAGSAGPAGAEGIVRAAVEGVDGAPRATKRRLVRYFIPPAGKGSAWRVAIKGRHGKARRIVAGAAATKGRCQGYSSLETSPYSRGAAPWSGVPTADGKAIVWYQEGERVEQAQARYYARILPGIWKRLTTNFREPLTDAGVPCYHGPDGRFDVYVNRTVTWLAGEKGSSIDRGVTVPYPSRAGQLWCTNRPSWIAIDQNEPRFVLAHELMHAIQFAYPYASCKGNKWWDEGGANWAGDFVYPHDNVERDWPDAVQDPLRLSSLNRYDYAAWPFWMALQRTYGIGLMRTIFARLRTAQSPQAVDAAIPGGLKQQWPRFAATVLNQAPVGTSNFALPKSFKAWDGWSQTPALSPEQTLGVGQTLRLRPQNANLGPLTVDAYHRVKPAGRAVREIRFKNGSPRAGVLALLEISGGRWTLADWSGRQQVTLCRDRPAEDVQRVILVTANPGVSGNLPRFTHELSGRAACETPMYLGRVSGTMDITHSPDFCPSHTHLGYSANLAGFGGSAQPFPVAAGTEAGPFGGDAANYGVSGSGTLVVPPCAEIDDPGCSAELVLDLTAQHGQANFRVSGATVNVRLESPTYGTTSEVCGASDVRSFLHGSFPLSRAGDPTITVPVSENSDTGVVQRTGSGTLTLRRVG